MNRKRYLLPALIVSIAVNLILIGGIGYRINNVEEFSGRPLPPNVSWMVRDLSEERRSELQPLLERNAEESRPLRRAMFDAQRRVNELMADQNYDPADLEQAFAELRTANILYQEMSHQHSVFMLNELSAEERQTAVELINRRGPRDGRDRRSGNDGGTPDGRPDFGPGPGPGRPPPAPPPADQ